MRWSPSKMVERILSLLIPPACREEVLGDLYESCNSLGQYIREAVRLLPMVIFSRVRRAADPQVLLMQVAALYLSFIGAAWYEGKASLFENFGLFRLAIPPIWVLLGLIVEGAYTKSGKRSLVQSMRGPVLGLGLAYLSQTALSIGNRTFALPTWIMFYGSGFGLLFSMAVNLLFPSVIDRQVGAGGSTLWLKYAAKPLQVAPGILSIVKSLGLVLLFALIGGYVGGPSLSAYLVFNAVLLLIFRELRRRR